MGIKDRVEKLINTNIRVFQNDDFDNPRKAKEILAELPSLEKYKKDDLKVKKLGIKISPEMRPCYEAPLLSIEQEKHLFRKMNFLNYKANLLIDELRNGKVTELKVKKAEQYIASAILVRNQIAEANFRLATQVLKSQISFYREHCLVESLLSDAYYDVLKAVEYFDWTKGYKFSTYATWVVKKNFYRDSKQKISQAERFTYLDETHAETITSRGEEYSYENNYIQRQDLVKQLLFLLSQGDKTTDRARQVKVLEHYFGVNGTERQTLEQISQKIGVTKERVRQLKEKGLQWIRQKAMDMDIQLETVE